MKIALYIFCYLGFLFPSLVVALGRWMDIADPPTVEVPYSFWLSQFGESLWFGMAFLFPAVATFVFIGALQLFWKRFSVTHASQPNKALQATAGPAGS